MYIWLVCALDLNITLGNFKLQVELVCTLQIATEIVEKDQFPN